MMPSKWSCMCQSDKKDWVHLQSSEGRPRDTMYSTSQWCWTWSKKPLMSMARKEDTSLALRASWMSCISDVPASRQEEWVFPPNWVVGIRSSLLHSYRSLRVTTFSMSFPKHSMSWIGWCALVVEGSLPGLGTETMWDFFQRGWWYPKRTEARTITMNSSGLSGKFRLLLIFAERFSSFDYTTSIFLIQVSSHIHFTSISFTSRLNEPFKTKKTR